MLLARGDAELFAEQSAEARWTALFAHLAAQHRECMAASDAVIEAGDAGCHALDMELALAPGRNAVLASAAEALAARLTQDMADATALGQQTKKTTGRVRAALSDGKEEWSTSQSVAAAEEKRLRVLIAQSLEHRAHAAAATVRGMDDADDLELLSELRLSTRKHLSDIKVSLSHADDGPADELLRSCDDLISVSQDGATLIARLGELNAALDRQRASLEAQRTCIAVMQGT